MKHVIITSALLALGVFVSVPVSSQTCPGFESQASISERLENQQIDESSGLAASARYPGMFWTHNDSGDDARVFLLDGRGKHIGTLSFDDEKFVDTEDIAVAPCERGSDESCIYVGDIGDNRKKRPQVTVFKVPEPQLAQARPFDRVADGVERIVLRYKEGARDAEALMVHPTTLDMYIVEKSGGTSAGVWHAMADTRGQPDVQIATRVASVDIPSPLKLGRYVTAGDFAPDGRQFSLRTYLSVFTWCLNEGESLADALRDDPTVSATPGLIQSEALAYDRDGASIWLTSERRPTPLIELDARKADEQDHSDETSD